MPPEQPTDPETTPKPSRKRQPKPGAKAESGQTAPPKPKRSRAKSQPTAAKPDKSSAKTQAPPPESVDPTPAPKPKRTSTRKKPAEPLQTTAGLLESKPGDPDIFGAQQYAPLLDIDVFDA